MVSERSLGVRATAQNQHLTDVPEQAISEHSASGPGAARYRVATPTPISCEIARQEAPEARRAAIRAGSAPDGGRPSRFPWALAFRCPAFTLLPVCEPRSCGCTQAGRPIRYGAESPDLFRTLATIDPGFLSERDSLALPFPYQRSLELGKATQHVEHQLAQGTIAIVTGECQILFKELHGDAALIQVSDHLPQIVQIAAQPIEGVNHNGVTLADVRQHRFNLWALRVLAAALVCENLVRR